MALIHKTTLVPSKLELVAPWLSAQPWYVGTDRAPELTKSGGFRLDDPEGEVGIEFMVVTDRSGDDPRSYHVPLTYRATALDGADRGLIGTTKHGVLGHRWVYDGTHDPVLRAGLLDLLAGRTEPQAQSITDTPDPTVIPELNGPALPADAVVTAVDNGSHGTDLTVEVPSSEELFTLHLVRALQPGALATATPEVRAHLTAEWCAPEATAPKHRALFAALGPAAP